MKKASTKSQSVSPSQRLLLQVFFNYLFINEYLNRISKVSNSHKIFYFLWALNGLIHFKKIFNLVVQNNVHSLVGFSKVNL